jgi:hypothetical protein
VWSWSIRSAMPRNSRASGRIWLAISPVPQPWVITDVAADPIDHGLVVYLQVVAAFL